MHSSGCTGVGTAIVAGNYIGLTAGNKGKLRLKPPRGWGTGVGGRGWKRTEGNEGWKRVVWRAEGNIAEKLREKEGKLCRPELSKQGAN